MPTAIGYLLDTNILLELARGNPRGQAIDARFALSSSLSSSMISVVTVGEMLALSRKFGWGQTKIGALRKMLDELVWIAATAKATGATLITTDPDFDHLHGTHITRIWFDPDMRKSP